MPLGVNYSDTEAGEFWYWYGKKKLGTFTPLSAGDTLTIFYEKAPDDLAIAGSQAETDDDAELDIFPEWEEPMMEWILSKLLSRPQSEGGDPQAAKLATMNYLRTRKEAAANVDRDVTSLGHGHPQE